MKTILKLSLFSMLLFIIACSNDDKPQCNEQTWYSDADGDTFGNANATQSACNQPVGYVNIGGDIDDTNASVFPNATEICDGMDNNGDGQVDEGLTITYYADNDNDGYGVYSNSISTCSGAPTGYVSNYGDCNDNDPATYPGATDIPNDGMDTDCDGND